MNALSPLHPQFFRITVLPGKTFCLYVNLDERDTPSRLNLGTSLPRGMPFIANCTEDGWLVVQGHGGMPFRKVPGLRCIEEAWEYEVIALEVGDCGSFRPIEDDLDMLPIQTPY